MHIVTGHQFWSPNKMKTPLEIRNAKNSDIKDIVALSYKAYPKMGGYKADTVRGQINNFREGCFVILKDDVIVAYSASLIIEEKKALSQHNWKEITANGFGSTHNPDGDYLYGYETCVDPEVRGQRLGQRIYNARKRLVKFYALALVVQN